METRGLTPIFAQPVDLAVDMIPAQSTVTHGDGMQAAVRVTNIHVTNGAVFNGATGTGWNCTLAAGHREYGICEGASAFRCEPESARRRSSRH